MENITAFEKIVIKGALEKEVKSLENLLDTLSKDSTDELKNKTILETNFKFQIEYINTLITKLEMGVK